MKRLLAWMIVAGPFVLAVGWVAFINYEMAVADSDNFYPGAFGFFTDMILFVAFVVAMVVLGPEIWDRVRMVWSWARREIKKSEHDVWP